MNPQNPLIGKRMIGDLTSPPSKGNLEALQREAILAKKRSKSFNQGRMGWSKMTPVILAQRFKNRMLTQQIEKKTVDLNDAKNTSEGLLSVERDEFTRYEKSSNSPLVQKIFIDQRKEAKPMLTPTKKKKISSYHSPEPIQMQSSRSPKDKLIAAQEHVRIYKEKLRTEIKKRKKMYHDSNELRDHVKNLTDQLEETKKKCSTFEAKIFSLSQENEKLRNSEKVNSETKNVGEVPPLEESGENLLLKYKKKLDEAKRLLERRKNFYEKNIKTLAKRYAMLEDKLKKVTKFAQESKKKNILFAKENSSLIEQLKQSQSSYDEVIKKNMEMAKQIKIFKVQYGDVVDKLGGF